jgi:ABC-type branched-subunit amino acid transport system ATPase component/ABC-type branched-subunit amino acid transport system permease subunit
VLNVPWLAGLPSSLPFLVLIVVLLVTPKRKLMRASKTAPRPQVRYHAPGRVRLVTGAGVLAALLVLPQIVGAARLDFYTVGLSQVIMILSLGLLVRTSGQVSICHSVFAAIGAVAFSQFAVGLGLPWLVALVLGGLVVVPVGALVALPAIRLSGIYLALATFGFGILVERLLYAREWFFTSFDSGRRMPRPSFAATDHSYYYVVLAIAVLTAVSIVVIHQTRLGRSLQGLADAPVAVTALGLSSSVTRVVVFAISAFMAGEAGVLYGCTVHFAIGTDSHYTSFYSLVLLATLAIAPFGEPWYGVMGGIAAVVPAYVTGINTQDWLNVVFGLLAVDVSVRGYQQMPVWMRRVIDRLGRRRIGPEPRASISGAPARSVVTRGEQDDGGLTVSDLSVRFGGVAAVDSVSFHAPFAQITGLIGPNGAGKTTTFDACSGLNRPREGTITLGGKDITRLGPAARARLGLGRTFQQIQLGESMTVFENVVLGREASFAGSGVRSQLLATRAERRTTQDATLAALELCGIGNLATSRTGALSTGQRRLVELARCLAGPFDMLLLDEPSSGLDRHETAEMERVLQMVVHERRCGILLVEHDMSLVLNICERVHVMDSGRLIFSGTKEEVSASPVVRAAYLGDQSSVLTRSMTT